MSLLGCFPFFFFFNDTATTEIYTLSLHDALPILRSWPHPSSTRSISVRYRPFPTISRSATRTTTSSRTSTSMIATFWTAWRSEEHTSELQSQSNLVCRLLLEKRNRG